jgi:serine protease inhibitor
VRPSRSSGPARIRAAVAAAAVVATAGCAATSAASPPVSRGTAGRVLAVSARPYGAAETAFGLDLLRTWCRSQPTANIVFSPASLATGLGLAYLGARGATATAMARVLHLPPASGQRTEAGLRAAWTALRGLGRPGVTLAGSNRVWSDPSLLPLRGYLNAVATAYGAGLYRVPLGSDPEKARQTINAAVASDTKGHIPDLLPPGSLTGDSWVLTDALYLDAHWARPFLPSLTRPGRFTTASGSAAEPRFMNGAGYRSAAADGWTAVSLPYQRGRLAMTALLPPAGAGSTGCQAPAGPVLNTLDAGLRAPGSAAVGVELPKVSLASHQRMNALLGQLGMGIAFGGLADFTGLSPAACCISVVEHAATLQVGERGTVGSAATAAGVEASAGVAGIGRTVVVFDRPYLMLVTDTASGEPLFLARVADPTAP